jgi:hypothetical protein
MSAMHCRPAPDKYLVQFANPITTTAGLDGGGLGGGQDGVDPLLSPLGYHYGPTLTQMIAANSPAVDAGANCPASDQRGISRPQGKDVSQDTHPRTRYPG